MTIGLYGAFDWSVRHFAERTALCLDDQPISYAGLANLAEAVSARLLDAGVRPGDRVALWMPNAIAWAAAFLGCAKAGVVSVPVNSRFTAAECVQAVEIGAARLLIAPVSGRGRNYAAEAEAALDPSIGLLAATGDDPADWRLVRAGEPSPVSDPQAPADLLTIQFTSGTTARPKGVMLSDRNFLFTASYVARCQGVTPETRFYSTAPFFHCSGTMHALAVCLTTGCTLYGITAWEPERAVATIERYRCDRSHGIFFRDLFALPTARVREQLASLQVGAAAGTADYLRRIVDTFGVPGMCNIYGLTETTGNATMWYVDEPAPRRYALNGRAGPGSALRVVGANGRVLGPDEPGEVQIRGSNVATGYFNDREAERAAFTADGWFTTGDLGRLTEDGALDFIGRLKELIRVGGENAAPPEIEQALMDAAPLKTACVIGVPDPRLAEVPVAVVVLRDGAAADWPQVMQALRARLADFKLPRQVFVAENLPVTPTNRVQKAVVRTWVEEGRLTRVH